MPSQSTLFAGHFLRLSKTAMISFATFSAVLPVTSSSHIFSFSCSRSASTRQTSRISEARFSHSLVPVKPRFSMSLRSSMGFRRRTKTCVVRCFGTTAAAKCPSIMMSCLWVACMVSVSFCCMAFSFMMVVWRFLSSPVVKPCVLAYSVRLMYNASSFVVSCLATVVLPTQGVPVMRMTRFMGLFEVSCGSYWLRIWF
jgi:hypothetical protein